MIGECSFSCDEGILVEGASWLMEIDTGESTNTSALRAAASRTRETAIIGGLKYSSNIGASSFVFKNLTQILSFLLLPGGFDPQLLVKHFTPVEDNTGVLEFDVLEDSTCLMLLEDVRGSSNLTFLTLFMGLTVTFLALGKV
ncbi:hypothetical protein Tco_1002847 [Tanacetum coccineum]|uniref:Uncharacterized protein n=1 Tax=Tanacetum coccineum TaxID=301880 RepID=A0ABQ5F8J6_9ASTR